ncbi:MAG: hypothetical protein GY950_26900 [bacterium]|nr:hypothetical protein [bacterium]
MGDVFLETISRLFPISSMWMFFDKIANEDNISISKMKKFLAVIQKVGAAEPVIRFKDMAFIQALFKRVYNANNVELNTQFFTAFENMKALDLRTYKYLLDAAGSFIQNRGVNITDPEKGAATKLKQRLLDQYPDIRGIENLYKELKAIFANKPVNLENLGKLLKTNHTSVALNIDKVCIFMAGRLRKAEYISPDDRELFVMQFPIIGKFIEYLWDKGFDKVLEWENITTQPKVLKHYVRTSQIVINFNKKGISALLKDQLLEAMPEFDIVLDKEQPEASDILICDTDILHDYVDKRTLSVRRIFLYLENRMDYAPFRELLPKAFMRPLSGYRVVKLVLKDLFL